MFSQGSKAQRLSSCQGDPSKPAITLVLLLLAGAATGSKQASIPRQVSGLSQTPSGTRICTGSRLDGSQSPNATSRRRFTRPVLDAGASIEVMARWGNLKAPRDTTEAGGSRCKVRAPCRPLPRDVPLCRTLSWPLFQYPLISRLSKLSLR